MTAAPTKAALVTGGAKRIGRAIALGLAEAGWDIVVHFRHSREEALATVADIEQLGRRAVALRADLSDPEQAATLLPLAQQALGEGSQLRCLVNNASLFEYDNALEFNANSLTRHIDANLRAPIQLTQALYAMTPQGESSVVINLLDQKLYNLNPDFLSYTLSKAGLQAATVMLAQALAPRLRVVGVAPGISLVSGDQTGEGFVKAHTMTPLGRSSTPADIASTVCFVAGNPAITGTTLVVDGGQHLVPLNRDVMFVAQ